MQARTRGRACLSVGLQLHSFPKVDYVVDLNSENLSHIENPYGSLSVHISHLFQAWLFNFPMEVFVSHPV